MAPPFHRQLVSGIADPFNGHIDEFRISHVQRSDGWIATTRNNISDPGAFAEPGPKSRKAVRPPLAGRSRTAIFTFI
jgi:hypothetical protein